MASLAAAAALNAGSGAHLTARTQLIRARMRALSRPKSPISLAPAAQASLPLRNAALGLHDPGCAPPEAVTPVLRGVLEAAARGRQGGALQADCAKAAGIPHKNFFYQVTRLEARGLLARSAVALRAGARGSGVRRPYIHTCALLNLTP